MPWPRTFIRFHSSTALSDSGGWCFWKHENNIWGTKRRTWLSAPSRLEVNPVRGEGDSSQLQAAMLLPLSIEYCKYINILILLGWWSTKCPSGTLEKKNHKCKDSNLHYTCNHPGHISILRNVAFQPTCNFHLTLIHCSYRLGCLGLQVLKCYSVCWGDMDKVKLQKTEKMQFPYKSALFQSKPFNRNRYFRKS